MEWKALLLVCRELNVRLRIAGKRRHFHHVTTQEEINDALESFGGLPELVRELSDGAAMLVPSIVPLETPLVSLTERAPNEFWPSPDDTRAALDPLAPSGMFDSVFVFWPQHDLARGVSVPGTAWGLGMGASDWSNNATYAAVANAPSAAWKNEARGEVWLHEWLHGVCHHFAQRGHVMPARDADGAELHGYTRSPTDGWTEYYHDLMTGNVIENGALAGIPGPAWA